MSTTITPQEQTFLSRLLFEGSFTPLNALTDAMPQLVWIAKPDGEVIFYSNQVSEFAGAKKEANGSWSWQGLLHPEDQEPTAKAWGHAVLSRGTYEKEHRVQMKDGSFRWHLSRAFPQKNEKGEVLNWFGTATDIHEQKLVEEKIKETEERWRTALEATHMGTWDFNPATKTFYLSDVARSIRGLGPEIGNHFRLHRETIHPDDIRQVEGAMQAALEQAVSRYGLSYREDRHPNNIFSPAFAGMTRSCGCEVA